MRCTRNPRVAASAALGGALCSVLALAACGLPDPNRVLLPATGLTHTPPAAQRVTQIDFGREARFTLCAEPACPAVTRKTLAVAAALPVTPLQARSPQAVTMPVVEPKSTLTAAPSAFPHKVVLHFSTDSALLTAAHKTLLRAAIVELGRTDRIVIVGRTDNLGSEARNQSIASARARAIREHLLDLAPDLSTRLAIDAKGRCCYAAPNQSPDGRAQNRRGELVFTLPTEATP